MNYAKKSINLLFTVKSIYYLSKKIEYGFKMRKNKKKAE
jgi:hypothetical protein